MKTTNSFNINQVLAEKKALACGKKIFVFTRSESLIYSCNLCGLDLGIELDSIKRHLNEITHKELSKIDILPYRSFMKKGIIDDGDSAKTSTCYDSLDSLRFMLETMCDLDLDKMNVSPRSDNEEEIDSRSKYRKRTRESHDSDESDYRTKRNMPTRENFESSSSYERMNTSDENEHHRQTNKRKISMLNERRDFPNHYESSDSDESLMTKRMKSIVVVKAPQDDKNDRTLMNLCRHLISLEAFLGEHEDEVRRLFTRSIELERENFGSSNTLLSIDILHFFTSVRSTISQKIDYIPYQLLEIVDLFYSDVLYFTQKFCDGVK